MTLSRVRLLDWRREFEALDPFIRGSGGVIRVNAADGAGRSTFAKALRLRLNEAAGPGSVSVQIDGDNPNTHYVSDILSQLEYSLGLRIALAPEAPSIQVGKDIHAQSVNVSDVSISVQLGTGSGTEHERAERIAAALQQGEGSARLAVIFMNAADHDRRSIQRFRATVWDAHLAGRVEDGLLLVDIGDPARQPHADWPPDPQLILDLPSRFAGDARDYAHEDLAEIALVEGLCESPDDASMFAKTLLASTDSVADLHTSLARAAARLSGP